MTKVQFGCGPNQLDGWTNLQENEGDITRPLNFADNSVDYILVEHVVEHVTHKQAWRFFEEAYRILKKGGVLRVIVPSVDKIWIYSDEDYRAFISESAPQWFSSMG